MLHGVIVEKGIIDANNTYASLCTDCWSGFSEYNDFLEIVVNIS